MSNTEAGDRRRSKVTPIFVTLFTVSQRVSGSSTRKPVSKPTERKKFKGALVSVASKDLFTVSHPLPPIMLFCVSNVLFISDLSRDDLLHQSNVCPYACVSVVSTFSRLQDCWAHVNET